MFEIGFTELLLVLIISFFLLNQNDVRGIIKFLRTLYIKLRSMKDELLGIVNDLQDIDLQDNMKTRKKIIKKQKIEYLEPIDNIKTRPSKKSKDK